MSRTVVRPLACDLATCVLNWPKTLLNVRFVLCGWLDVKIQALTNHAELRSCVKVEVDVLGSLSLIVLMVSVDVRQHFIWRADYTCTIVGSERVKSGLFCINSLVFFFFLMDLMLAWFAAVPEAHIAQLRIPPPPPQPFVSVICVVVKPSWFIPKTSSHQGVLVCHEDRFIS